MGFLGRNNTLIVFAKNKNVFTKRQESWGEAALGLSEHQVDSLEIPSESNLQADEKRP